MIALNNKEAVWVVEGPRVDSQKIEKQTLNFKAKPWWNVDRHKLYPTTRVNVLSPARAALIAGLMARYEFNI